MEADHNWSSPTIIDSLNLFSGDDELSASAGNPWLPAYGFQQPHALLEKDDFLANTGQMGDSDLFLQAGNHYIFLETIQEETSDDLRSDSDDFSDSRPSPVGWLATDSESGSVIRIQTLEDAECESDREVACPAKRRRQEQSVTSDDDDSSISRSSSLMQFENLEKQCYEISTSSPSIFSSFSYDSLERKADNVSPDSLERSHSDEESSEYYKTLKIDLAPKKTSKRQSRDSLLYDNSGSDSADSEETLEATRYDSCRSVNLKTWRSFDGLHASNGMKTIKISSENLSEDSGYSDHLYSTKCKSSSIPNMVVVQHERTPVREKNIYKTRVEIRSVADDMLVEKYRLKGSISDSFDAYDGDVFHTFTGNFGVSYHDLSMVDQYEQHHRSPLIERFMRNGALKRRGVLAAPTTPIVKCLNLESATSTEECVKYSASASSASEPNLLTAAAAAVVAAADRSICNGLTDDVDSKSLSEEYDCSSVCVSSVPKDLNLAGSSIKFCAEDRGAGGAKESAASIAAVNCDLSDMPKLSRYQRAEYGDKITIRLKYDTSSMSSASDVEATPSFKREGSYLEAMTNSIDMSDDESARHRHAMTVFKFDRENALKAISETSLQSCGGGVKSIEDLNAAYNNSIRNNASRTVASTPNLNCCTHGVPPPQEQRKSSLINRSTSTTEVSDGSEDKMQLRQAKSLSGSSKGVHFSPVIAEVNWRDDSVSTREESSCSTTPEREIMQPPPPPRRLFTRSQPALLSSDDSTDAEPAGEVVLRRRQQHDAKRRSAEVVIAAHQPQQEQQVQQVQHSPTNDSSSNSHHVPMVEERQQQHTKAHQQLHAVRTMEAVGAHPQTKNNHRGIGGFFSRIASFRFSTRAASKHNSDDKKSKQQRNKDATAKQQSQQTTTTGQRLATKDDYIYIPLKGPPLDAVNNKCNNNAANHELQQHREFNKLQVDGVPAATNVVASKPPLPKQPPRVVGASVKRRADAAAAAAAAATAVAPAAAQPNTYERRTIDSGLPRPMESMGLIETDLDTEVTIITSGAHAKTRSLMNLGHEAPSSNSLKVAPQPPHHHHRHQHHHHHHDAGRPHKSMEFLLDKQNLKVVEPPENELQKGGERVMSEHELRVQRSLQKLNVPEWYKAAQVPREGFLLNKNKGIAGGGHGSGGRECRWQGTGSSKTTSLSSLGSATHSPLALSPTAAHYAQPFVRWSTSKLNSTASSPCASTRSSFNARQPNGSISPSSLRGSFNYRQPYLGWRSQERLARPRTPAERLASSILGQTATATSTPMPPQESPEIQTSIKEVTSAIVHYVSGLQPNDDNIGQRSRSVSPRGSQKLCWLESSFVGTRPLDSPQTPVTLIESPTPMAGGGSDGGIANNNSSSILPPSSLRLDLQTHNDTNVLSTSGSRRPSPSSTTLEDVLDSLLGLPSSTRAPSPSLQGTASANTSPERERQGERVRAIKEQFRRRSEGSDASLMTTAGTTANAAAAAGAATEGRRASLHSPPLLRCRNTGCARVAAPGSAEAAHFKNCHNCAYSYCSRTCRREHWEKHRKTCLFSRVGSLCRQAIAATKEQEDTLRTLSVIARRGYLAQGHGAVKIFFPCPDAAEKFLGEGLAHLGEPTFVRWTDLLPSEMGPQLYAELVRMCKNYNPDVKLVLYVSVCVVSEAPAAGSVKWERQLVSRCGKLRLSRDLHVPERDVDNIDAIVFTCAPIDSEVEETLRRLRDVCAANIQKHLRQRGVSLRNQYPHVHQQLTSYVAGRRSKFTPVTIYPTNAHTSKPFMCILMPEVDPQCVDQVTTAGVRVKIVNILDDEFVLDDI